MQIGFKLVTTIKSRLKNKYIIIFDLFAARFFDLVGSLLSFDVWHLLVLFSGAVWRTL